MVFQIRHQTHGSHVHCSLYVAQGPDRTFALCGTFLMKPDELAGLMTQCPKIRFVLNPDEFAGTDEDATVVP